MVSPLSKSRSLRSHVVVTNAPQDFPREQFFLFCPPPSKLNNNGQCWLGEEIQMTKTWAGSDLPLKGAREVFDLC